MSTDRDPLADIDRVILALNDWMSTYAPEMCNEADVKAAYERIGNTGKLYYIALALSSARAVRERLLKLPGMP